MLISAGLIVLGIAKSLRGLLIPWLLGMLVVIIFQILWSIWLCYGYYIYVSETGMTFPLLVRHFIFNAVLIFRLKSLYQH